MYGLEHGGMAWGWPGMILMWLIPVLLIAFVVRIFIARTDARPRMSAREILDVKYADGEIGRDEYLKRLGDLKS